MEQDTIKPKRRKPLFLLVHEAKHALGWSDEQMRTIRPLGGFTSKAHEKRWNAGIMRTYLIFLDILEHNIKLHSPHRQPFLDEAIAMAQERLALIEEARSAKT